MPISADSIVSDTKDAISDPFGHTGRRWDQWSGKEAIDKGTKDQLAALEKAYQVIQQYTGKAIDLQSPYTQNGGQDFARQRGLVQSGYFQTPNPQSFNPQQYRPSGFTMNPSQGMASFQPQSFQRNGYTPQGLPPMPNMPAYQPPPPQQQGMGMMGGPAPAPAGQPAQGGGGLMGNIGGFLERNLVNGANGMMDLGRSAANDPFSPKDPIGMMGDRLKDKALGYQIPSTGNEAVDAIVKLLDPRNPIKLASDAGDTTKRLATKGVKGAYNVIKGLL